MVIWWIAPCGAYWFTVAYGVAVTPLLTLSGRSAVS